MTFSSMDRPKSPRMVPGAASAGFVDPMSERTLETAPSPEVSDEALVERLALMLGVVGLGLLGGDHLEAHLLDGEASALETVNDLADVAVAHAVGLDHRVGLLNCHVVLFPFPKYS